MAGAAAAGEVQAAAQGLRYRDFLTVALVIDGEDLFPDNWIYIHEPDVRVGRIQNFRSWSPWMVPDQSKACVGLEYFCFQGDDLWEMDDDELVELAKGELGQLGLADPRRSSAASSRACRSPTRCTTPTTPTASTSIRGWLEGVANLQQVGRNGLHRYNNSDHSMLTAIRAVENILDGAGHDIWAVNAESVYHEEDVSRRAALQARARDEGDARAAGVRALRQPASGQSSAVPTFRPLALLDGVRWQSSLDDAYASGGRYGPPGRRAAGSRKRPRKDSQDVPRDGKIARPSVLWGRTAGRWTS